MGRPLNKRFFGADAGADIKVQFFNGTKSVPGYLVKQKGAKKFLCRDAKGNEAICMLVDKAAGDLVAGEMSITVKLDSGEVAQVTKIAARKVTVNGVSMPWNFDAATDDGAVQVEEAGVLEEPAVQTPEDPTDNVIADSDNFEGDVEEETPPGA